MPERLLLNAIILSDPVDGEYIVNVNIIGKNMAIISHIRASSDDEAAKTAMGRVEKMIYEGVIDGSSTRPVTKHPIE